MLDLKPRFSVEMIEKRNAHYYTVDNHKTYFPGSTTVLNAIAKPGLVPWAINTTAEKISRYLVEHAVNRALSKQEIIKLVADAKKEPESIKVAAGNLGTRAHKAIDQITKGEAPTLTDDIRVPVGNFLNWQKESHLKIFHGDLKLAYVDHASKIAYGGSLDGLATDSVGHLVVIDYKTSNSIHDDYAFQVASYCHALQYTYDLAYVPEGYCVRFHKIKSEVEIRKIIDVKHAFEGFKSCYRMWEIMKQDFFEPPFFLTPTKEIVNG